MKPNSEEVLQLQISAYIKLQYPNILFNCDLSGVKLTMGQAAKVKKMRSGKGWPDMFFPEPRWTYKGLFIELKTADKRLKNGKVASTEHVREQEEMITKLTEKGYYACFCCGFDEAKRVIDYYFA